MATKKCLSLIYEIKNYADTYYLGKVTKFPCNFLLRFWSSEPFTGLEVENTPSPVLIWLTKCVLKCSAEGHKVSFQKY